MMTKEQCLAALQAICDKLDGIPTRVDGYDEDPAHREADDVLLKFINDKDIEEAYLKIPRWFS